MTPGYFSRSDAEYQLGNAIGSVRYHPSGRAELLESPFGQGRIAGLDACAVRMVAAGYLVAQSRGPDVPMFGKPLTSLRDDGRRHYPPSKNHCGAGDGAAETGEREEDCG